MVKIIENQQFPLEEEPFTIIFVYIYKYYIHNMYIYIHIYYLCTCIILFSCAFSDGSETKLWIGKSDQYLQHVMEKLLNSCCLMEICWCIIICKFLEIMQIGDT